MPIITDSGRTLQPYAEWLSKLRGGWLYHTPAVMQHWKSLKRDIAEYMVQNYPAATLELIFALLLQIEDLEKRIPSNSNLGG